MPIPIQPGSKYHRLRHLAGGKAPEVAAGNEDEGKGEIVGSDAGGLHAEVEEEGGAGAAPCGGEGPDHDVVGEVGGGGEVGEEEGGVGEVGEEGELGEEVVVEVRGGAAGEGEGVGLLDGCDGAASGEDAG